MKLLSKIRAWFYGPRVIKATYCAGVLNVWYEDGQISQYKGQCTVWYKMPYMERCSAPLEAMLCELWEYIMYYKGAYPDAHKKPQ